MIKKLPFFLLAAIVGFALFTALWGIDFGRHWDESAFTTPLVKRVIESGRLLPSSYGYPSMWINLTFTSLLPDMAEYIFAHGLPGPDKSSALAMRDYLATVSQTKEFLLRTRGLFAAVSILSLLWVFFTVYWWRREPWEAFLASAILGLSWEVAYHLRWVTPGTITMQFAALSFMLIAAAVKKDSARYLWWLAGASAAGGVALGTRYMEGLLIAPILIAVYVLHKKYRQGQGAFNFWLVMAGMAAVFFLAYLVTTPGTVLDPVRFAGDVFHVIRVYATDQSPYSVSSWSLGMALTLEYLSLVLFSHYVFIAVFFFLLSCLGVYALWREDWKMAILFLSFPLLSFFYISSLQTMYVRNLMPIAPFLAILAARGVFALKERYRAGIWIFGGVMALAIFFLGVNAGWLWRAADSVKNRDNQDYAAEFNEYLKKNPDTKFLVSKNLRKELEENNFQLGANVTEDLGVVKLAAFRAYEVALSAEVREEILESPTSTVEKVGQEVLEAGTSKTWGRWHANRFNYTVRWFGPYEVNFNYYPGWIGNDRIVVMPVRSALKLDIF